MRYVRFRYRDKVRCGILENKKIRLFETDYFSPLSLETVEMEECEILSPIIPTKILCIGLNYKAHSEELEFELPKSPVVFMKPNSSIIGPDATIVRPKVSQRVDYEGELCVVIGKQCKNVSEQDALKYVLGYTIANDVTARDMQDKKSQWTICKGFDTFCPTGPFISDEVDPGNLDIRTELNGKVMQSSNTKNLIFSVPYLISYLSSVMTLEKGDVILTGTPRGISGMEKGDVVEVFIEGLGKLRNIVE